MIKEGDETWKDKLKGAKFRITNVKTKKTWDVKIDEIINLNPGDYKIEEIQTPYTDYYNFYSQRNRTKNVTIKKGDIGKLITIYMKNTKYGDLEISKVDSRTKQPLEDVGFKIYFEEEGNGKKHYILKDKLNNYSFTTNEQNAYVFVSDKSGKIEIKDIPLSGYINNKNIIKNKEEGKFYVEEVQLSEFLTYYYELKNEATEVKIYPKTNYDPYVVYYHQLLDFTREYTKSNKLDTFGDKLQYIYDKIIDKTAMKINSKDYEDLAMAVYNKGASWDTSMGELIEIVVSCQYKKDENGKKLVYLKSKDSIDIYKDNNNNSDRSTDYKYAEYLLRELSGDLDVCEPFREKRNGVLNGKTISQIENPQIYTDVSGYVWEDKHDDSKKTVRNNLYDQGEKLIENIPVVIKDKKTNTVAKDGDGNELRTLTDKNGEYKFRKVKIDNLNDYYVEFEYNGLKYQNIDKNLSQNNGSKAEEYSKVREEFNNSFASITGGEAKGETTKGYSIDSNEKITNNLTYQSGNEYDSKLVENTGYTVTSANGIVTGNNTSGVSIKADTLSAGYEFNWQGGMLEITNVNLGLYEREQPDMAIDDDVDHISLEINGYEHSYVYRKREKVKQIDVFANDGIFSGLAKWGTTPEQKQEADYPTSYTRAIYKNDANASGITGNGVLDESKKLRVNIIYKLVIKNESTSLEMSANEIASYYDETLDYVESWYMNGDNKVNVNWDSKDSKDGFKQLRTNSLKDVKIPANKSITVYLKMKKNTILKWAQMDDKYEENTVLYSEITSYSTYYDNKYYAGIDKDSAPDNVDLKNIKETGEDDTASAPDVNIVFKEPRAISGYVFEDDTDAKLKSNDERKGDGKYSADRDGFVGNVNVELLKASNGESVAYIYPKAVSELNLNAEEARYTTSKDGKGFYSFVGVIPDEYILKFTYGDGSVIYKTIDGNATEIKVTTQDYKSTIVTNQSVINAFNNPDNYSTWYRDAKEYSSAVDDYTQRIKINTALKDITNKSKTEYEAKSNADLQKIIAKTPKMKIGIENTESNTTEQNVDNQIDNIDFGIVERPRMSLKVTKEISHIKLTLANGQTLVDGDPRTTQMQYVTYPKDGILKIEVDNEIVEGSTVEIEYDISVENNSELDYNSEQYYKYGIRKNGNQPVGLTISSIVDYLDENLATTYNYNVEGQNIWKRVESKTLNYSKFISNDIYNAIKNKKNIFVNECQIKLQPGQKTNLNTINTLKASKLLTTANELLFTNYVETLKVSNEVGRFYGQEDLNSTSGKNWKTGTPGNFNPYNAEDTHESDDNKGGSTVAIIPPTGLDKNIYVIGSIIGIIILSAIAGVIVYIKKRKIK